MALQKKTGITACFFLAALSVRSRSQYIKKPPRGSFFLVGAAGIEPATPTV